MLLPVNRAVENNPFQFEPSWLYLRGCMLQTSWVLAAIVVNSNYFGTTHNCSLQKKYEEDLCSFPSQSPCQPLTHFPTQHPQWHRTTARGFSGLGGGKKTHWFFCIVASQSEYLLHWEAVSKTTRALIFVVLWLFLPKWNKTIRPATSLLFLKIE